MKKIVVIGSSNIDYAISVKNFPLAGETILAKDLSINYGGKGGNQAVALARSGADVAFISPLGQDLYGQDLLDYYKKEGIDVSQAFRFPNHTGMAFIAVDDSAENKIIVQAGSNHSITAEDILGLEDYIKTFDICLLQFELPLDVVLETLKLCKKHGMTTVLNPAPYHEAFDLTDLKYVDYFIPNELEFSSVFKGIKWEDIDDNIKKSTNIIVTQGKKGSLFLNKNHFQSAIPANAVDTTAAGDTYVAYFVNGLAKSLSIDKAMNYASYASSLVVQSIGTQNAIPFHHEVEELMNANK